MNRCWIDGTYYVKSHHSEYGDLYLIFDWSYSGRHPIWTENKEKVITFDTPEEAKMWISKLSRYPVYVDGYVDFLTDEEKKQIIEQVSVVKVVVKFYEID